MKDAARSSALDQQPYPLLPRIHLISSSKTETCECCCGTAPHMGSPQASLSPRGGSEAAEEEEASAQRVDTSFLLSKETFDFNMCSKTGY